MLGTPTMPLSKLEDVRKTLLTSNDRDSNLDDKKLVRKTFPKHKNIVYLEPGVCQDIREYYVKGTLSRYRIKYVAQIG